MTTLGRSTCVGAESWAGSASARLGARRASGDANCTRWRSVARSGSDGGGRGALRRKNAVTRGTERVRDHLHPFPAFPSPPFSAALRVSAVRLLGWQRERDRPRDAPSVERGRDDATGETRALAAGVETGDRGTLERLGITRNADRRARAR